MRILVTGSTGLVGSALVASLEAKRHQVVRLSRGSAKPAGNSVSWNPETGAMDRSALEGIDAVVHLAGENIAARRWSQAQKARIRDSRVAGTRHLCENLAALARPPKVLACASAIGYYGDRGSQVLREDSTPGSGFLPEVCRAWEAAASPAADKGIRTVHLRFSILLSAAGGALAKMLPPFRMGIGGRMGDGRQYMSWITLDDTVRTIEWVLDNNTVRGPINVATHEAATNEEFTKTLGHVLRRPTLVSAPAFAVRLVFGEMGDALLLASTRVEPARLEAGGFRFQHPELEMALRSVLAK